MSGQTVERWVRTIADHHIPIYNVRQHMAVGADGRRGRKRLLNGLCVKDQHLLKLVGTGGPPVRVDIAPSSSTPPA
jgi:hypothetical protein